ncbi:MAG: hypothetical protein R3E63_10165 [Pseudomonadales bacterium]
MNRLLLSLLAFFVSTASFADGPRYQVLTQLEGMTINYFVSSGVVKTTLYATNHDRIPVICDAKMITNRQEVTKAQDQSVAPQQTAVFAFRHGKSITDIRLYLMCTADKNAKIEELPPTTQPQKTSPEKRVTPQKTIPVVEEDLGRY